MPRKKYVELALKYREVDDIGPPIDPNSPAQCYEEFIRAIDPDSRVQCHADWVQAMYYSQDYLLITFR